MPAERTFTLSKDEKLCSRKVMDALFNGGKSRSMVTFPLRVVYMEMPRLNNEPSAQILVSVPKRKFKRAVKRNRVKRQVREAYRLNKSVLFGAMEKHPESKVCMAFVWLDDKLYATDDICHKMVSLLKRVSEKV